VRRLATGDNYEKHEMTPTSHPFVSFVFFVVVKLHDLVSETGPAQRMMQQGLLV
jgi:hypothetical protein